MIIGLPSTTAKINLGLRSPNFSLLLIELIGGNLVQRITRIIELVAT